MEGLIEREVEVAVNERVRSRLFTARTGIAGLVLACVVLFSLYVRVADYGFYEDDYWGIVPFFKKTPAEMWQMTISHLQVWPTGRPLNHILPKWFSWLGYHLAGVQGIYFLGFLVHTANAFLLYLLLRRWLGNWAALLGGCLLVLIPADTTRIFLLHSAHIHTSLTFLLVALLIVRTRYWAVSYPIAGLSLLSYETAFLPFIAFPLFFANGQKRIFQWLRHLGSCGLVLAIVFGVRLHLGDDRANSVISGPGEMLWRMVSSMWIGPETSLKTVVKAVLQGPHSQSPFAFLFAGLVVISLLLLPSLVRNGQNGASEVLNRAEIIKVLFAGLASWIFAYALTLTNYPPTFLAGRLTSTHIAADFGLACFLASGAAYLRSYGHLTKLLTTGAMAALVAFFTLYSFRIQSGYALSWAKERVFWRHVVQLCPDIAAGTRIILTGHEPSQNEFIMANSWADLHVLEDAFALKQYPLLFYYDGMAKAAEIRFENGQITWKPFFWGKQRETLNLDNVIILKADGDELTRIGEFQIPGIPFPLHTKPLPSTEQPSGEPQPSPSPLTDFGRFLFAE
jgi:hypothetical protein